MQELIYHDDINKQEVDLNNQENLADNEFISKRVSEIRNNIQELFKELDEVVSMCNHKDGHDVKLIANSKLDSGGLRRVCKICKTPIGYASKKEADEWQKD
tara:strand:- start:285 stop:587 length:303 start_codon:yes stop_codon:yes gene_type:complete